MAAVLAQEKFETFTGLFAGMPAPTGIAPRLRAAEILWERASPRRGQCRFCRAQALASSRRRRTIRLSTTHITTIETPTNGNITPSTSITPTAAFHRGRS